MVEQFGVAIGEDLGIQIREAERTFGIAFEHLIHGGLAAPGSSSGRSPIALLCRPMHEFRPDHRRGKR